MLWKETITINEELAKRLREYLQSEAFEYDIGALASDYMAQGLPLPPAEKLREEAAAEIRKCMEAGPDLQEKCGYWGERLVLKAQMMGLNTCWVALTFSKVKSAYTLGEGEKLAAVIALGHGATQGAPRKSKTMDEVTKVDGPMPDWFRAGMEAVLLAPTAVNQQKFLFTLLEDGRVFAQPGHAFYVKMDLKGGFARVRLHFLSWPLQKF